MSHVPAGLQSVLWSINTGSVDMRRDAPYIVHQILAHGNQDQINCLFAQYSASQIKEIFIKTR